MNLHPTNARRVFPCIDEPTETPLISFTINDVNYQNLISNSNPVNDNPNSFTALSGAPFRWALFGHNFTTYDAPNPNVLLSGRPGLAGQENVASQAINSFYLFLNTWTDKSYFEIVVDQSNNMHIIALPDVDIEWNSLSIVGLW
ncbi:unnamed protein product [Diatraea saccharalis]|nr:unnamed protein product [Diatraea saccharalis]